MPILTVYENFKPDKNFYSVERSGFIYIGELLSSMTNDMLRSGSFTIVNVIYRDTSLGTIQSGGWPVNERRFNKVSGGKGYLVDQFLSMEDGTAITTARFGIQVTTTDIYGTITGWKTVPTVNYSTVDTVQPRPMALALTLGGDPDYELRSASFLNQEPILNSSGNNSPVFDRTKAIDVANSGAWDAKYGYRGSGFLADLITPSTAPTRHTFSANTIWSFIDNVKDNNDVFNTNFTIKVGQEVFLKSADVKGNSYIPPGTTITAIRNIPAVVAGSIFPSSSSQGPREFTAQGRYFLLSNVVTLARGQIVSTRGYGAEWRNDIIGVPDEWTVILQSTGAVDPLSDPAGVVGNVWLPVTNSNIVPINNLDTINAFDPKIWPGHRVTSVLSAGSLVNTVAYVKDVLAANITHARVELTTNVTLPQNEPLRFVFEDPQTWRVKFQVRDQHTALIFAGTEYQIPDNGKDAYLWNDEGNRIVDIAGVMGAAPTMPPFDPLDRSKRLSNTSTGIDIDPNDITQGFINRKVRIGNPTNIKDAGNPESYPMNYTMSITDRGLFFGMWESNWSVIQKPKSARDVFFSWVLIQRPVDRVTGRILTKGRCPLFCINSVGSKYWKFIVREADAQHPTQGDPQTQFYDLYTGNSKIFTNTVKYRTPADTHTEDSFGIINSSNQIALTEDSKFLISFLHNLTTPRFRYSEELDLIGQTSADVCMATNDISITAYLESGPRIYRAMPANNPYNTGLRIAVLKDIPNQPNLPI